MLHVPSSGGVPWQTYHGKHDISYAHARYREVGHNAFIQFSLCSFADTGWPKQTCEYCMAYRKKHASG